MILKLILEHNNNIIENISIWSTSFSNEESFISIGNGEFRTNEYSGNFNITDYSNLYFVQTQFSASSNPYIIQLQLQLYILH